MNICQRIGREREERESSCGEREENAGKKETFVTNILLQGMTGAYETRSICHEKCLVLNKAKSFTNEKKRYLYIFLSSF